MASAANRSQMFDWAAVVVVVCGGGGGGGRLQNITSNGPPTRHHLSQSRSRTLSQSGRWRKRQLRFPSHPKSMSISGRSDVVIEMKFFLQNTVIRMISILNIFLSPLISPRLWTVARSFNHIVASDAK